MATDARGHTVPAGSDAFDPQGADVALSASITDITPVANQTARDSLATAVAPTVARPLFVWREDTKVIEWSEGSGFQPYPPRAAGVWGLSVDLTGIASGTFTQIPAATAVGTPDAIFTNASGSITVGRAGKYEMQVQARWLGTSGGSRRGVHITKNGTSISGGGVVGTPGTLLGASMVSPTGSVDQMQSTRLDRFDLASGDVVRVFAFHDAGAAVTIAKGANTDYMGLTTVSLYQVS